MINQKKLMEKILDNKQFMLLFSIVTAFLFWFFVVAFISPDATKTISGVPVTVNESSGFLSSAGLHVIEESQSKISIQVSGPRYLIGSLTSKSFTVTPNLGPVTKSGTFSLELNATVTPPNPKIKILAVSPSKINVHFDTLVSKNLPVEIQVGGGKSMIASDYIMEDASASPQQITVTGSSAEIENVAHAIVKVDIGNGANSTLVVKKNVSLYDSKNNLLSLKHIKIDNPQVTVTVPILKTKQVSLAPVFENIPVGFDIKNIKYTVTPSTITIAGKDADVDTVSEIKLQSIDFLSLGLNNIITENVLSEDNVANIDNIQSATVNISLLNTGVKTLNTANIKLANIPSGYSARVRTKQISGIKLFGPSNDIGNVADVLATVDLSNTSLVEGQSQVPVTISVPGKTGYWVTGKYNVVVQMWKND